MTPRFALCIAGDPSPDVTFYKGDKQIKVRKYDKRIQIDWNMDTDVYELIIKNAKKEDAGDYVIKAENSTGHFTYTVSVVVGKPKDMGVIETSRSMTSVEETIVDGEVKMQKVTKEEKVMETVEGETITKVASVTEEVKAIPAEEAKAEVSVQEVKEDIVTTETVEETVGQVEEPASESEEEEEEEDSGAPTIEVAPEPVCVAIGETICLTTKVTG